MTFLLYGLNSFGTLMLAGAAKYGWDKYQAANRLNGATEDLVTLAKENKLRGRVHGRNWLITDLISKIGTGRGVVVLHGEPGTGKTALIEEIAFRIAEGQIPELMDARVLRLKPKEVIPKGGVVGLTKSVLYGSLQDLLDLIFEQLRECNQKGKRKTILFIDEFHKLFWNKIGYDLTILMNHLPDLDEYGVILVGATSDKNLVNVMKGQNSYEGSPLARRLKDIAVPEMTPKEAIEALQAGRVELGKGRGVDLKEDGVEALVFLIQEHNKNRTTGKFPDKAIKFFEEIAEFAKNRANRHQVSSEDLPVVNAETVSDYLSEISPHQETKRYFVNKFASYRAENGWQKGFFDQFFPLVQTDGSVDSFRPLRNLSQSLNNAMSDATVQTCLVKTNSNLFLRKAVSQMGLDRTQVRSLSVQKLLAFYQRNPEVLPLLKQALAQMGEEVLLLEDTASLLLAFASAEGERQIAASPAAPNPATQHPLPAIGRIMEGVDHLAAQGLAHFENQIGFAIPTAVTHARATAADSPLLQELRSWILRAGNRSILAVSPSSVGELKALQNMGWPLLEVNPESPSESLSPFDVIQWLRAESGAKWVDKLVFFIYRLWKFERDISHADLCYAVFKRLKEECGDSEPTSEALCNAICGASKGGIRKLDVEEMLKKWDLLEKREEISASLSLFSPRLADLLDEALQRDGSLLKLVEADPTKSRYLISLIEKHARKIRKTGVVDFAELKKTFPTPALQNAYLEKMVSDTPGSLVLLSQEDLTPSVEEMMKKFHRKGLAILCVVSPKAPLQNEAESGGVVERVIRQGADFLNRVVPNDRPVPPTPWIDEAFVKYENGPFTQEQFQLFFIDLVQELNRLGKVSLSEEGMKAFMNVYFYLYKLEKNPLSLDRIKRSLAVDLQKEYLGKQAIGEHLFQKFGKTVDVSKKEILYHIDPSSVGVGYRLLQLVRRIVGAALRYLWFPVKVPAALIGKGVKDVGGWMAGGAIFSFVRRLLFGG